MSTRRYHPRAFRLLFGAGDLKAQDPNVCHWVEGTVYSDQNAAGLNVCGQAATRRRAAAEDVTEERIEFDSLNELVAKLGLDTEGAKVLVSRIQSLSPHV